jgi:hypothetical protein
MKSLKLALVSLLALSAFAACDSGREVEVTGEVSAAQAVSGAITLKFYEMEKGVDDAERLLVKEAELAGLGTFTETIEVAEDIVIAVALVDTDGDGACTAGELWAESQQQADADGNFAAFQLSLVADPCPAPAAE